jgi:NADH-quinone oxidoreductase subunit H
MSVDFWTDPVNFVVAWLSQILVSWGLPQGLISFLFTFIGAAILATGAMLFVIFLIWYERKLIGRIQDRLGPNRVGPFGIFQPFADMLKIFTKEYITPFGADKIPYNLAPILAVASVLMIWAVIPFTERVYGVDLNVGILYIVAVGALGAVAIILAGWSSNNKYAMLGAFRMVAMLISYEVPMVLSLLVPVFLARSMGINDIIRAQDVWFMFVAPIPAFIFFITSIAEIGRSPFDLLEAESEIVSGFNIEYSGLKFGMFYVAEFLHAFTISLLFATIFMGGWRGPFVDQVPLLGFVYLFIKTFFVYFLVILFRGSLPRLRLDQIMDLNWKILTPLSLVAVVVMAVVEKVMQTSPQLLRYLSLVLVNIIIIFLVGEIMRTRGRQMRTQEMLKSAKDLHTVPEESATL